MAQEAHCRAGIHIQRSLQRSIKDPESAQDDPRHGELQPSWVQAMQQTFQLRENTGEGQGIFPGDSGFSILPPHRQTPEFPAGNEAENKKSTLNPELPSEPCSSRQQFNLSVPLPGLLWAPGVLYFPTLTELPHLPRQSWGKWPGDTWQLRPHLQQDSLTFGTLYYFHVMLDWGDQAVLYAPIPWEQKNPAPTRRKLQWLFWFQNYVWNLKSEITTEIMTDSWISLGRKIKQRCGDANSPCSEFLNESRRSQAGACATSTPEVLQETPHRQRGHPKSLIQHFCWT